MYVVGYSQNEAAHVGKKHDKLEVSTLKTTRARGTRIDWWCLRVWPGIGIWYLAQ